MGSPPDTVSTEANPAYKVPDAAAAASLADPVIAGAIRDRLEHSALTLHITGESYRGKSTKTCQQEKGYVKLVA
jgi:hypothetical protein